MNQILLLFRARLTVPFCYYISMTNENGMKLSENIGKSIKNNILKIPSLKTRDYNTTTITTLITD